MEEASSGGRELIRWYNLTPEGNEVEKLYTFHNYADRWYVCIQRDWVDTVSVTRGADVAGVQGYVFSAGRDQKHQVLFTIYAFTGTTGRSWLPQTGVSPGKDRRGDLCRLPGWWKYGAPIGSKKTLISYFNFIREDWKTGEM